MALKSLDKVRQIISLEISEAFLKAFMNSSGLGADVVGKGCSKDCK